VLKTGIRKRMLAGLFAGIASFLTTGGSKAAGWAIMITA
jgi:hypothetical protein